MNKAPIAMAPGFDPLEEVIAAQAGGKPAAASNIEEIIRDELNPLPAEKFDPQLHETNPATGGPFYNQDGTMRRKRGRRPGQAYAGGNVENDDGDVNQDSSSSAPMSADAARAEAKLATSMAFATLQSLLGDEWQPDDEERDGINDALAEYIRTTGGIGLPPWATVALAFGSYAVRRTRIGEMFGLRRSSAAAMRLPPSPEPDQAGDDEPIHYADLAPPLPMPRGTSNGSKPAPERPYVASARDVG